MTDRQYFFRTFGYVNPYKIGYWIGTFFYCFQVFAIPLMTSIFYGGTMAAVLSWNFSQVLNSMWTTGIMFVGIAVLTSVGSYLYVVNLNYARRDMQLDIFRAFTKSSIENQRHSGEGIAAINTDASTATDIFSDAFTPFFMNIIAATFSVVTVFIINWRMGLGAIAVGVLAFFVQSRFAAPLARLGKARLSANADSVKSLSNIWAGAITIKAYNRQDRSLIQFDRENGQLKKLAFKQAFIGMWQDLFTTVQGWLTLVFVFALGGWLVILGQIDLPQVMMVLPLATAISGAMSQIGTTFAGLQPPIVAAKRIFDIVDSSSGGAPQIGTGNGLRGNYDISISKLEFVYKDADTKALNGLSLSIKENEMIAFVGESGSGKSTLLRTIIGMYERDGLDMEIGGLPFAADTIGEWRRHFAYVDQSCKLFDMSIAENITIGLPYRNQQDMIQAAKRVHAHDFISDLSEGYTTSCGEKGASLSGGQRQRITIARALCRKAPILVFDEATSALDAESERGIMETIQNLRKDHTILITTHNLSNIITADKIVVMDNGLIAECGTHHELLEKGGLYTKLLEG